jgi:hypothetical protein
MRLRTAALLAGVTFLTAGCINPRSYTDPNIPAVSYESIQRRAEPYRTTIVVEFQRNGVRYPKVEPSLTDIVTRTVRGSGVFVPSDAGRDGQIRVTVNNIADQSAAALQGAGTGMTFGAVGTTVTDNYELAMTVTLAGVEHKRTGLRHSLHTAFGSSRVPPGVQAVTTQVAFERVVEQLTLTALQDLQRSGELEPRQAPIATDGRVPAPPGS